MDERRPFAVAFEIRKASPALEGLCNLEHAGPCVGERFVLVFRLRGPASGKAVLCLCEQGVAEVKTVLRDFKPSAVERLHLRNRVLFERLRAVAPGASLELPLPSDSYRRRVESQRLRSAVDSWKRRGWLPAGSRVTSSAERGMFYIAGGNNGEEKKV